MAVNLWRRWKDLMPDDPILVGTAVAIDDVTKRTLVQFPGGSRTWVMGAATVSMGMVFVQSGKMAGEAPSLPLVVDEV